MKNLLYLYELNQTENYDGRKEIARKNRTF
jgi:hypothetical protein